MNTISGEENQEYLTPAPQRPTFLTVLCVLTFVVSGYYFLSNVIGLFTAGTIESMQWGELAMQLDKAMESADTGTQQFMSKLMTDIVAVMEALEAHIYLVLSLAALASALSLLGAYLMFQLRRAGFYIYAGAKALDIFAPLLILGVNLVTALAFGFVALVSIGMILLYASNRKHLR